MSQTEEYGNKLDTIYNQLENLEKLFINPVVIDNDMNKLSQQLTLTEYAKLNASLAFVSNALYFCIKYFYI